MWTLAEANVECRVMSGATAAGADEAGYAEKRESAGGGDCREVKVREHASGGTTLAEYHTHFFDAGPVKASISVGGEEGQCSGLDGGDHHFSGLSR